MVPQHPWPSERTFGPPALDSGPMEIVLYGRPGCHLCDQARDLLVALLAQRRASGRPVPMLVERDIESDPSLARAFFTTIPVVELGGRRIELATSQAKLRRLLATLDIEPEQAASRPS